MDDNEIALEALSRIEAHEKECGMRWKEAYQEMKSIHRQLRAHSQRWEKIAWLVVGSVVVGILTVLFKM